MKKYLKIYLTTALLVLVPLLTSGSETKTYSLDECIDYALKNSTDLSRSNNEVKSQRSTLEQSKEALFPNLSLSASQNLSSSNSYSNYGSGGSWNRDSSSSFNVSLSSGITLFNSAKLRNTITRNRTNLAAAETDVQTEKEQLSLNVLTAYINVLLAKEQVGNSEAQLKSMEKQLEYADVRKTAGIISNADYLNIKSQYASEKATFVNAQTSLQINLVSLMQLMNMPIDDAFSIKEPDITALLEKTPETDAEKIYSIAININPEIKSAELNYESAKTGVKIAEAGYWPSLTLSASVGTGYNDNLSEVGFNEQLKNQVNPSVGLSLSIPIYSNGDTKNSVEQAAIQADNLQLTLTDIKNNLRKAIEQACVDAKTANMTYQASIEQYQAEQESYRSSEEMFSQGLVNSTDFITSKNNLIAAESSLIQAKYNVILQSKMIDYYLGKSVTL